MYEKVKCEVSKQYGKTATKLLGLSKSSEKSLSEPTSSKAKQAADGHQDKHSKRTPSKRTRKGGADIEEDYPPNKVSDKQIKNDMPFRDPFRSDLFKDELILPTQEKK